MGTTKTPNRMTLLAQTFLLLSVATSSVHGSGSKKGPASGCSYEQFIKNGCKDDLMGSEVDGKNPTYDTCYVTECPPNVVFILDGSDSISPSNFRLAQDSLAREMRAVSGTFANTNVGVVLFSDVARDIPLEPRTPVELEDVIRQVQALSQPRRRTSLTEAFSTARQMIEDYSSIETRAFNGVRSGGVIVLLSDGYTNNIRETLREAQEATKEGILVVSLSVGPAPSRILREISRVVQDQTKAINWTSLVACPGRILGSVPKGSQCRDILLTVDASDSVLQQQETVRQFLAYTVLRYRLVNNAIGVNLYGTNSQVQAVDTRLRLEENKYDLSERIRLRLTFPSSGGTGTDRAVLQSKTLIDEDIRGRASAIIVFIDGPTLDQEATRNAISQARNSGILVIIVRVGPVLTDAELSYISGGDQSLVFSVQSFTDLYGLDFDSRLCDVRSDLCSIQCPSNSYRTANCSCVCSDSGTVFDQYTRTCVCPQSCPSNSYRGSGCSCLCYDSGLVFDSYTRTCVPTTNCPYQCPSNSYRTANCSCVCYDSNTVFDQSTRTCVLSPTVCPLSCPSNSYRGTNCSCVCYDSSLVYDQYTRTCVPVTNCPYTCPSNTYRLADCSCVCYDSSTVFDQYTRTCVCPQSCPSNAYRGTNCSCVCYDSSLVYDQYTRTCVPVTTCPYQCPSNSYRLANCSCVCYDSGSVFDQYSRTCVPVTTCPYQCPSNSYRLANCSCVCYDSNTAFDQYSRTCVPVTTCTYQCPSNSYRLANCSCVCYDSSTVFDQYTRTCVLPPTVCPLSCPSNSYRGTNCSCVCYDYSLLYDQYTRTCVPVTTCPYQCPSNSYRLANCSCVCYDSNTIFDQYTRTCVSTCPRDCPFNAQRVNNCDCRCLDTSLAYNVNLNLCVSCPESCPPNTVRNSDCTCGCPTGQVYNITTRSCESSLRLCPASELRCENNQPAYKDCSGQCYCACSSEFAGTRCEIKLQPELCNDCQYVNGHYQSGVMGYCDLYVECIPVNTATNSTAWPTSFVPLIRSCAPGTYYVTRPDGTRVCDFLYNGKCSQDKCQTLPPNARYSDPSSCQSYWECGATGRLTARSCCLPGQRFNPATSQCVYDSTCQVTCGVNRTNTCNDNTGSGNYTGCPFSVNPVNPTEYFYRERPLEKFLCQPTNYMDLTVCTCMPRPTTPTPAVCAPTVDMNFDQLSTNNEDTIPRIQLNQGRAGNFNGSNDLILKAFAGSGFWTDYFRINLRLFLPRSVPAGQRTAVVTNANCGTAESVSITMDDRNFYFRIVQIGTNQTAEITIPYQGSADINGWYTVVLLYRKVNGQFQFSGTVGSNTVFYSGPLVLSDYIDLRVCALHLGTGDRYSPLVGYVDDFQVWRCNPSP